MVGAGLFTWSVALPVTPSTVAVMVADPAAIPCATPALVIVAVDGALLDQVTVRPLTVCPAASAVALKACSAPTRMVADDGVTVTLVTTGGVGVVDVVPPAHAVPARREMTALAQARR